MFETGFPMYIQKKVHNVLGYVNTITYSNVSGYTNENNNEEYELFDGSIISFPERIYFIDDENIYANLADQEEKLIYNCMFTRSCNGYVRERHLKEILVQDYPVWCMPYILKLSSEYIVEILKDIYKSMESTDNSLFQTFCEMNPYMFRRSYSRMTSYWNEYYRNDCFYFNNYVGYKLYKKCFGYSERYDKI